MKKSTLLATLLLGSLAAGAQATKLNSTSGNNIPRAAAVPTLKVAKEGTVVGFEKVIAPGRLSLSKSYTENSTANETAALRVNYFLTLSADNSFNNRKPVKIGLSRKSFDSVFTRGSSEMAGKYAALNKYVTDRKISLSDENGWVAVVNYFNQL